MKGRKKVRKKGLVFEVMVNKCTQNIKINKPHILGITYMKGRKKVSEKGLFFEVMVQSTSHP